VPELWTLDFTVKYYIKSVATILFVVLSFCGYSQTPQELGDQIADADHVVAYCEGEGSTFSVAGQGTKYVIRAVATAEKIGPTLTAPSYWIQFYSQTNLLCSIGAGDDWFMHWQSRDPYIRQEYNEKGHVLRAWLHRLATDKAAQRAWVNLLAQDVIKGAGVTNLQSWSVELLKLCESGQFGTYGFPDRYDGGRNVRVSPQPKVPGWAGVTNRWPQVLDPQVFVHYAPSGKPVCVLVTLVDLPIPYGLALGPTNYQPSIHAWYTTNCAPGIYAFHRGY
jgi:hypothetical protein